MGVLLEVVKGEAAARHVEAAASATEVAAVLPVVAEARPGVGVAVSQAAAAAVAAVSCYLERIGRQDYEGVTLRKSVSVVIQTSISLQIKVQIVASMHACGVMYLSMIRVVIRLFCVIAVRRRIWMRR